MRIDVITLFPEIVLAPSRESIIGRAQREGILELHAHNLRDWATDKRQTVDGPLCGGGQGMLLKPEPLFAAIEELRTKDALVVLLTPQGKVFKQAVAAELSAQNHLILVCGHYEGVDQRVIDELIDLELSIGDYVLTNGAVSAAVVIDAVVRLLPDALGNELSAEEESFSDPHLLEAPNYTKPINFKGFEVPKVLSSGNHQLIIEWRNRQAVKRTKTNRPDLRPSV